ncbi:coiled-coil domain-containing protein 125 [Gadus morhua]|uniref:coiled-coil domain-containing protein 125 n=1 Tax=Gadus morhua TaxID=8049 RepID=UPI0011B51B26|nr:coiled-coil domain-containing protein 125 [Gadus morhua]XP_030214046.1 coiled-coil domain-containing protein 125 [Gadus morhua]XP_030214047.1 coiled-coil domain-containing protein 125 [Gadus morhua]
MQGNVDATGAGAGVLDDNMAEGDLGDGMDIRLAALDIQTNGPQQPVTPHGTELHRDSTVSDTGFSLTSYGMPNTSLKTGSGSLVDLSKEELRERLQEATETLEVLRCELEVTHRYLEGKYEALKILQGKTILEKATSHTKSLLQKSEERARALEKEVNGLQWEITSNQVQMKKCEQSWEQKFNRMNSENQALTSSLEERLKESRELKAENTGLSQQCMELLSMLSVREQKAYESTKPPCGHGRDGTLLELAVLGACRCPGVMESCPCAKTAAASRTQLLQLRQELDLLVRSREEALLMADAFRIAFEQQLRKRSDCLLLQAEARTPKAHPRETQGGNRTLVGVAQRLRAILPSGLEAKASLEHTDTLQKLLDLLNDKEEALAHQRKVSHMLAHNAKELQKQLPVEATWPLDSQTEPL